LHCAFRSVSCGCQGPQQRLPQPAAFLADPESHGRNAGEAGAQLSCLQSRRGAAEYLAGLACAKSQLQRGCSSAWGRGLSALEGTVPTAAPCRESTLRGGCPPPSGNQGLPTRLFWGTAPAEGVGSASLQGHEVGLGPLSQACEGRTTGFAGGDQRKP